MGLKMKSSDHVICIMLKELQRLNLDDALYAECLKHLDRFRCTFDVIDYAEEQIRISEIYCPF